MHVTFYTKPGCHLCDEAELMLKLVQEDFPLTWKKWILNRMMQVMKNIC